WRRSTLSMVASHTGSGPCSKPPGGMPTYPGGAGNARAAFLAGHRFLDQGDGRQPEPIGAGVESPPARGRPPRRSSRAVTRAVKAAVQTSASMVMYIRRRIPLILLLSLSGSVLSPICATSNTSSRPGARFDHGDTSLCLSKYRPPGARLVRGQWNSSRRQVHTWSIRDEETN